MTREWKPPEQFDEYRVVRGIGAGAMGQVFLAHDTILDRPVAVKFMSIDPDSAARDRFLIEARALARLQHPNVVAVYRVGELARRPYLVSEFIRGQSLDRVAKPLPWRRVLELAVGIARGLAAAHRRGVLHRDIKPGNTLLAEDGDVKLVDFGLAKLMGDGSQGTSTDSRPAAPASAPSDGSTQERSADPFGHTVLPTSDGNGAKGAKQVTTGDPDDTRPYVETGGTPSRPVSASPSPELTHAGAVMGTPYYMPPEAWRGEPPSARGDVYSVGVMLYELCSGKAPNRDVAASELSRVVQERDPRPLNDVVADVDRRFASIIDRCVARVAAERFASGEELRDALEQFVADARGAAPLPEGNPYRGLLAFEAEHRALFFGRGVEVRAVLDRLRSEPFVLVAGDSGVGKSSLCRAGVLPAITEGALGDGRTWKAATLVAGRRPRAALAAVLAHHLEIDEAVLDRDLAAGGDDVYGRLRRALAARHAEARGLVLFVDQLEELVTLAPPSEAAQVGECLAALAGGTTALRVLASVRGDFLTRVAGVPGLGADVARALYLLRPLGVEGLREAIVGPARAKGVSFESEQLLTTLVDATARAEAGLPLLQFALAELWEARDDARKMIPNAALEQIGGVSGALARHADETLARLLPAERAAARRILLRVVTTEGVRARRAETDLVVDDTSRAALDALVRGRLLVPREDEDGRTVEIAHEALVTGWATLRGWLDENADQRVIRQRLEQAATEWRRLGESHDVLWGRRQLAEARPLDVGELGATERAFLGASARTARRRRFVGWLVALGVPLAIGLTWIAIDVSHRREAERAALKARAEIDARVREHMDAAERFVADARANDARVSSLRTQAFAAFDRKELESAETTWTQARTLAGEVDRTYGLAAQELESALMIDPTRATVRDRLGQTLYERALDADRDGNSEQRDELFRRFTLYDDGGRQRSWNAPATLAVTITPASADIVLERIEPGATRNVVETRSLGLAPFANQQLAPGSYALVITAPGRATLRYPIYVRRGERLDLAIAVPAADAVPEGYVYVAPGRFLVGTADESLRREFLTTVPLHEARTGGYLIAKHEVTYGDWLEFLDALPPRERELRRPRGTVSAGLRGANELAQTAAGWTLRIAPRTVTYTARFGEPITYQERDRRARQDWRRFPVSSISGEDSNAYVAWLASSGRLRNARLCTEHEWERAARGADGREWPAGDWLAATDANLDETYGKRPAAMGPDEVGSYPASRSPFGIDDMAGNIAEWTTGSLSNDKYAGRGGAYYYGNLTARSSNRWIPEPSARDVTLGFRVCADLAVP